MMRQKVFSGYETEDKKCLVIDETEVVYSDNGDRRQKC